MQQMSQKLTQRLEKNKINMENQSQLIKIFRSSGQYIGFVSEQNLFSWSGEYLGWIDDQKFVWDKNGIFRGQLIQINNNYYIIKNKYLIPPISKNARASAPNPAIPAPLAPLPPISLPLGTEDAF